MIKTLFLNPANLLSMSRIFLSIPLFNSMKKINPESSLSEVYSFLFICLLILLTDLFDGAVARKFNFTSNVGKILDPVADKICVFFMIIYLSFEFKEYFFIFFLLILVRDFAISVITLYFIKKRNIHFQSNMAGKWFLFFIGSTMILFILDIPTVVGNNIIYLTEIKILTYYMAWLFFILSTFYYFKTYFKEYLKFNKK